MGKKVDVAVAVATPCTAVMSTGAGMLQREVKMHIYIEMRREGGRRLLKNQKNEKCNLNGHTR